MPQPVRSALLTLLVLLLPVASFAITVETNSQWNGTSFISSFGVPNTATYGQVIKAPAGASKLTSFSFQMRVPTTAAFRGEVYAWDGLKATGPNLFESAVTSTSDGSVFQQITFNTGGINVNPGQEYVIFASTSKDQAGHSGTGQWGAILSTNVYPDGTFVFQNNGTDTSQWTSATWATFSTSDLAFTAVFDGGGGGGPVTAQGVPTLSEWAMILLACGLAAIAFRKLRAPGRSTVS